MAEGQMDPSLLAAGMKLLKALQGQPQTAEPEDIISENPPTPVAEELQVPPTEAEGQAAGLLPPEPQPQAQPATATDAALAAGEPPPFDPTALQAQPELVGAQPTFQPAQAPQEQSPLLDPFNPQANPQAQPGLVDPFGPQGQPQAPQGVERDTDAIEEGVDSGLSATPGLSATNQQLLDSRQNTLGAEAALAESQIALKQAELEGKAKVEQEAAQRAIEVQQQKIEYREKNLAKMRAEVDKVKAMKLDPNRMWNNAGTGQKMGMIAGIIASGLANGRQGGPNLSMQAIEKAIDQDIAAQKYNMGKAKDDLKLEQTLFEQGLNIFGDREQAATLVKQKAAADLDARLAQMQAGTANEQRKLNIAKEREALLKYQVGLQEQQDKASLAKSEREFNEALQLREADRQESTARSQNRLRNAQIQDMKARRAAEKARADAKAEAAKKASAAKLEELTEKERQDIEVTGVLGVSQSKGSQPLAAVVPGDPDKKDTRDAARAVNHDLKSYRALREKAVTIVKLQEELGRGLFDDNILADPRRAVLKALIDDYRAEYQRHITGAQANEGERKTFKVVISDPDTYFSVKGADRMKAFVNKLDRNAQLFAQEYKLKAVDPNTGKPVPSKPGHIVMYDPSTVYKAEDRTRAATKVTTTMQEAAGLRSPTAAIMTVADKVRETVKDGKSNIPATRKAIDDALERIQEVPDGVLPSLESDIEFLTRQRDGMDPEGAKKRKKDSSRVKSQAVIDAMTPEQRKGYELFLKKREADRPISDIADEIL